MVRTYTLMTTVILSLLAVNIGWAFAGAIHDYRTMRDDIIGRNLSIATRNIKCSVVNVAMAIIMLVVGGLT